MILENCPIKDCLIKNGFKNKEKEIIEEKEIEIQTSKSETTYIDTEVRRDGKKSVIKLPETKNIPVKEVVKVPIRKDNYRKYYKNEKEFIEYDPHHLGLMHLKFKKDNWHIEKFISGKDFSVESCTNYINSLK